MPWTRTSICRSVLRPGRRRGWGEGGEGGTNGRRALGIDPDALMGSLSAEAAERLGDYLSRVGAEEIRTGEAAKRLADVQRQGREA